MTLDELVAEAKSQQTAAQKERKAEHARINGAKSKGPITAAGKLRSSCYAIRHGMTANEHTVLEGESLEEYEEVRCAFIQALKPANLAELRIVEKIANHDWRLERHIMLETALLNMRVDLQLDDITDKYGRIDGIGLIVLSWLEKKTDSDCSDLLRRYMGTAQHQFNKMYDVFCKMKKPRIAEAMAGDTFDHTAYEEPKFNTLLKSEIEEPPPSYDEQYGEVAQASVPATLTLVAKPEPAGIPAVAAALPPAVAAALSTQPSKAPRPSGSGLFPAPEPTAHPNEPTNAMKIKRPKPIPKRPAA